METVYFNRSINVKKPVTIKGKSNTSSCPFCDLSQVEKIIDERDDMILIENKFKTMSNCEMLVLIETRECKTDMHQYSIEKLNELLSFAINKWKQMQANPEFKSVIMFKNKGHLSGGTLSHPHMQIIGMRDADGYATITKENVDGLVCEFGEQIKFKLSDKPFINFLELNIDLKQPIDIVSNTVKFIVNYIEDNYWGGGDASYNLFFYTIEGNDYLKIIARYPTSPITLGFDISMIYDDQTLSNYRQVFRKYYNDEYSRKELDEEKVCDIAMYVGILAVMQVAHVIGDEKKKKKLPVQI